MYKIAARIRLMSPSETPMHHRECNGDDGRCYYAIDRAGHIRISACGRCKANVPDELRMEFNLSEILSFPLWSDSSALVCPLCWTVGWRYDTCLLIVSLCLNCHGYANTLAKVTPAKMLLIGALPLLPELAAVIIGRILALPVSFFGQN
jgi:hypothetical protein